MISELNRLHKMVATRSSETVGAKSSDGNNLLFGVVGAIFVSARALVRNPIPALMVLLSIASRANAYEPTECLYSSPVQNDFREAAEIAMGQANRRLYDNVLPDDRDAVVLPKFSNSSLPLEIQADYIEWGGALCGDVSSGEKELGGFGGIYKAMRDVAGDFAPQFDAAVASLDVERIANALANGQGVAIRTFMPTGAPTSGPTLGVTTESPTEAPTEAPTPIVITLSPTKSPTQAPTKTDAPSLQPTSAPTEFEVSINGEYFCTVAGKQLKQMGCKDADFQMLYDNFFAACGGSYTLTNDCAVRVSPAVRSEATRSGDRGRDPVSLASVAIRLHIGDIGEIGKVASHTAETEVKPVKTKVDTDRKLINGAIAGAALSLAILLALAAATSKTGLENSRLKALANESFELMPENEIVKEFDDPRGDRVVAALVSRRMGKVFSGDPANGFKEDRFAKADDVTPTLMHDDCTAEQRILFEQTLSELTDKVIKKMDWTGANGSYKEGAARAVVIGLLSKIHQLINGAQDGVMGADDQRATRDPRNFQHTIELPGNTERPDTAGWHQTDTILSILTHAVDQVERTGWTDWATSFGQKPAYDLSKADEYLKTRLDFSRGIRPLEVDAIDVAHGGEGIV